MAAYSQRYPTPEKRCAVKEIFGQPGGHRGGVHPLLHMHMSKGLLYVNTMPKGQVEWMLAFLVPTSKCRVALNGVHHDTGHQGQQRMLALVQEHFWWPMMVDDCRALVQGC